MEGGRKTKEDVLCVWCVCVDVGCVSGVKGGGRRRAAS